MKVTDISAGYSLPRIFLIVVNMHTIKFTILTIVKCIVQGQEHSHCCVITTLLLQNFFSTFPN